jgi:hypothetical protein
MATASVIRGCSSSKYAGRGGTKTLSLMYPHIEKSRGVKSGNCGGQAIVPPYRWNICRMTQGNHSEHLQVSVDKT